MPRAAQPMYHKPSKENLYRSAQVRRFPPAIPVLFVCLLTATFPSSAQNAAPAQPTILYGAAYYNEYMPAEADGDPALRSARLEKDVALMKAAGISVVRMGESTWSLWEPQDGHFEYAWMDSIVDAMGKAGIKVIMGTPTYSVPTWMVHAHPEILARYQGADAVTTYGIRQNMDTDNPTYRFYAQRVITNMVAHYRDNPTVIGWQIDNETGSYGAYNPDVFAGFVDHLKQKFVSTDAMNKAWFLNYWGQDVNGWENMPTPDHATNPSFKLEWSRWEQMRVTDFLSWQAALVRQYRGPNQFVTHDYGGMMHNDRNENQIAASLDIVANNIYHRTQDHMDGAWQAEQSDFARSLKHGNFLVTETNAQTLGWDSASLYPPYDGQLRLDVYTYLSSGANMVEYWHWHSIHSGQETYWQGVLGHDLEPNRAYAEVSRTAHELQKIGPKLVDLKIQNKVAILYSVDSDNGINFMPYAGGGNSGWQPGKAGDSYTQLVLQFHTALYNANLGADFVFPDSPKLAQQLSQYKLLIVPALYVADDALLKTISDYVKNGGHVLMTFKSGYTNENDAVRWERAPGPLREAAGFTYQEFSNLEHPLALKDDPYQTGADNKVNTWAEFLQLDHAKALAWYDHPFFGQWPAITRNQFGSGELTYEGTQLSDALQAKIVLDCLKSAGLTSADQQLPPSVHVKHGVNREGKQLHYYLNYSSDDQTLQYPYAAGHDLLTGTAISAQQSVTLKPWDLAIVEEN